MPEYRYPKTSVIAMSRGERARLRLYSKRELEVNEPQKIKHFVKDYVLEEGQVASGVASVAGGFSSGVDEVVVMVEKSLLQKFTTALDLCVGRGEITKGQRESVTVVATEKKESEAPKGVVGDPGPKGAKGEEGKDELPDKWAEPAPVKKEAPKKKAAKKTAKKKTAKKKEPKPKVEEPKPKSEEDEALDSFEKDINAAFGISDDDDE